MIYLDTSFLAPFYIREATNASVETILLNIPTDKLAISDWTTVEFTSLVSRRVRMNELNLEQMEAIIYSFKEDTVQSYT
ncbi:MAG: type II toxin-antitoxin system VapC family toxin [Rivularia sp. (in: cyanobacteria)]